MSEEGGAAPEVTALGGQGSAVGDVIVWELDHLGSGFVTATDSPGDHELGLCSNIHKMKKVG